jgi:hypothetical protein
MSGRRCDEKRRYASKREADEALLDIMIARAFAPDDDPVRAHPCPCRSYKCWHCDGWHLTTKPLDRAKAERGRHVHQIHGTSAADTRPAQAA